MQLSALTTALGRFVSELQRRKVIRVASLYVVGAWIVLQVALALQSAIALSSQFSAAILALLVIGFPIAVALAWFFEITPEGVKRTSPAAGDGALVKPQTTDLILAGALGLVVIVAVAQWLVPQATAPAAPTTTTAQPAPAKPKPPTLGDKSIAVLPFANLSPDKDDAYFADGLTEEILNTLSQIRELRVISRTSSFAFKGKDVPLTEIAKQLSVRYVLEGSVRRDGDDVRITAQLIEVATDAHIWSKTFEPKLQQIFVAQAEIAGEIALAMEVEVELADGVQDAPTKDLEAYTLYLKGRELSRRLHEGDSQQALEALTRAIELDPDFVHARVALAFRYINLVVADRLTFQEFVPKARQTAEAIRKLNPKFPGAIAFLASVDANEFRWHEATENAARAVVADPSNSSIRMGLGVVYMRVGLLDRAVREFTEARRLDPLNGTIAIPLTYGAFARGDDKTVSAMATRVSATSSEVAIFGHWLLASVAQRKGNRDEVDREFRAYMAAVGKNKSVLEPVSRALKNPAAIPQAVAVVQREQDRDPVFNSTLMLQLIDPAGAYIDYLQSLLEDGDTYVVSFAIPTVWRVVVDHGANPKIKKLFRDTGLVDYWKKHGWPDRCRPKGEDDFECS